MNTPHLERLRIYQYTFGSAHHGVLTTTIQSLEPKDILDIQERGDELVMWVVVDVNQIDRDYTVQICLAYTGDPPPGEGWFYVKTIQSEVDGLVYHLYIKQDW